jgi:hypothetical protein
MRWLRDAGQDVRYAIRSLRRSPGFASIAILTLALGIGATTATYSVVDTILLRPLPFADSDRLVRVIENVTFTLDPSRPPVRRGLPYQDFLEWRTRTRTLTDTFAVAASGRLVRTSDGTARLWGSMTSASAFSRFGARPMLGRTLDPGDDANPNVVVLSFDTWRRHFHADPAIVGTTIEFRADWNGSLTPELEHRLLTVVGVMPAAFEFPTGPADFYTPVVADLGSQRFPTVTMIGRLRDGVTMSAATVEANAIGSAIRALDRPTPRRWGAAIRSTEPEGSAVQGLRPALRVFLTTVVLVLLIVCANVANLLLARGTARQRGSRCAPRSARAAAGSSGNCWPSASCWPWPAVRWAR